MPPVSPQPQSQFEAPYEQQPSYEPQPSYEQQPYGSDPYGSDPRDAGEDVNEMSGDTFDDLIAVALREYGYEDIQLATLHDSGGDLVASRNGRLISIHVKRWE